MQMKESDVMDMIYHILIYCEHKDTAKDLHNIEQSDIDQNALIRLNEDLSGIFSEEPSLLNITGNTIVVGDLHGNLTDLLRILEKFGYPPETSYLFLGDYVDRGENSLEVITTLFCLKFLYRDKIHMIRGNHECQSISQSYGFKREILRKYDESVYYSFIETFQYLPFAAVLNNSFFCVHGGIGPKTSLKKIEKLPKPMISSDKKLSNDLVWSDPLQTIDHFILSDRGAGHFFGPKQVEEFLVKHNLSKIIRSHQCVDSGFDESIPNCITLFSNTDYCETGNAAAVGSVNGTEITYTFFRPLSKAEKASRRIIYPSFILNWISSDDKAASQIEVNPLDIIFTDLVDLI